MPETIPSLRLIGAERVDPAASQAELLANVAVEDVPLSSPARGDVILEPLYVGICGSDNSATVGKPNFDWVSRPRTIGHECSARVVGFGPDTLSHTDLEAGDVVCIIPMKGCGDARCRGCGRGRPNYCRQKTIFGFHRDGALAQRTVCEVSRCLKLPDGMSSLQAAAVEPLSVVTQAIYRKCNIQPGMDVIVSGCGIIGLMAAELARAAGARVAVTGLANDRDVRLQLAEDHGFIPIVVSSENPLHEQLRQGIRDLEGAPFGDAYADGTVDLLIECSGAPAALANAGLSVQLEGKICVIATFPGEVPFAATQFTRSGQTMAGVMGSNLEDFRIAQKLILEDTFPVEEYSTIYSFADVRQALVDSITAKTTKAIVAINQ